MSDQTKKPAAAARPALPTVTLGKLEAGMELVEQMVDESTIKFIANGQAYKDRHREGTRRPLNIVETAQIAAGLGAKLEDAQEQLEEMGATAYDEPEIKEVLLAAGAGLSREFLGFATRFSCLIEMPAQTFDDACEASKLHEALDEAAKAWSKLDLADARARASRAMAHFSEAAGFDSGKALALAARAMWQGLWEAMRHLDASGSGSSIVSAASTGGPAETSSTTSPGETS